MTRSKFRPHDAVLKIPTVILRSVLLPDTPILHFSNNPFRFVCQRTTMHKARTIRMYRHSMMICQALVCWRVARRRLLTSDIGLWTARLRSPQALDQPLASTGRPTGGQPVTPVTFSKTLSSTLSMTLSNPGLCLRPAFPCWCQWRFENLNLPSHPYERAVNKSLTLYPRLALLGRETPMSLKPIAARLRMGV